MTFLNVMFMIISVLIIILALLQSGKDSGLGVLTGNSNNTNAFVDKKERGPEVVISRITMVLAILFFTLAIVIHFLITQQG